MAWKRVLTSADRFPIRAGTSSVESWTPPTVHQVFWSLVIPTRDRTAIRSLVDHLETLLAVYKEQPSRASVSVRGSGEPCSSPWPSALLLCLDELLVLARLPGCGQHGQLPQGTLGWDWAGAFLVTEVVEDGWGQSEQADDLADPGPGQTIHPRDLGGVRGLASPNHPLESAGAGQVAPQAAAAVAPGVVGVCPASVSRKGFACPASNFPRSCGGFRVSRKLGTPIPRAQVGLRRPWLPETESWMRGQRSFYDPGVKHLGRSSYLDQFDSPLLTIDRTLVVEVVVPRAIRREHLTRERMIDATRERWGEWQRLLDEGVYDSKAELARSIGVSRAVVTQGLRRLD